MSLLFVCSHLAAHQSHVSQVRKRVFLRHFKYKNDRFYQDRLGTNIGKTQKEERFSATLPFTRLMRRCPCIRAPPTHHHHPVR